MDATGGNACGVKDGSAEVEQTAPILVMLNDHCFQKIFRRLDIEDLLNVANVCVRFNQNAKKIYSTNFRTQHVSLGIGNDADNLLLNFGSTMESVSVYSVKTLEGVSKHCKSLRNLEIAAMIEVKPFINYVQLNEELMKQSQPLFAQLEKLSFTNCLLMDHIKTGLNGCQQLKFLRIENTLLEESQSELTMYSDDEWEERNEIMPFANFHSSEFFRSIEENVPNLEELHIHVKYMEDSSNFQNDVLSLSNLSSLKVLDIHMYGQSASNLLKAIAENDIQIEEFKLKDVKMDTSGIQSICKIKSITKIEIADSYAFDNEYLVTLAEGLPQLNSLTINYPEYGGQHINTTILENVARLGKKLSKLCVLNSCYEGIDSDSDAEEAYEAILPTLRNRTEKIGLNICIAWDEVNDRFERETELDNGEQFKFCVHFYNGELVDLNW